MKKTKLPIGVTKVKNRSGLYRFRVTVCGKLHAEYFSIDNDDTLKQTERNRILQNEIDLFREKCVSGMVIGDISDKDTFSKAVTWYLSTAKTRDSSTLNRQRIDNADIRILLTLCLDCGLRNGEARALSWNNIDFTSRVIHIKHGITKDRNGKEIIGIPKTKRSRRDLPLSLYLHDLLLEHKERQDKIAAERGTAYNNRYNLVATNTAGNIMQLSALTHYMKRIREENPELPADLHTHSLRHSFCSLLIARGYNVVLVAALLGDTVEMVTKIYAHSFKALEREAMSDLSSIFNTNATNPLMLEAGRI